MTLWTIIWIRYIYFFKQFDRFWNFRLNTIHSFYYNYIGISLNFFSWFSPQCHLSNILKKSTIFIAMFSTFSLVNYAWYVCKIVSIILLLLLSSFICVHLSMCASRDAFYSNLFAVSLSSSIISKSAFLASMQNLQASLLQLWLFEYFKNAVAA